MIFQPLIVSLHKIGAVKFGQFTLKSGQPSKIYLDLRQIISYPDILRSVADAMWHTIHACKFDLVCGVPYTALPIATCLSLQHGIPMIMRRKEKKAYGTKQQIEGSFRPGQTCLIIEDIITTGGSILETTEDLLTAEIKISDAVVLINREQGGEANLKEKNIKLHSVLTMYHVMKTLLDLNVLSDNETKIVQELLATT